MHDGNDGPARFPTHLRVVRLQEVESTRTVEKSWYRVRVAATGEDLGTQFAVSAEEAIARTIYDAGYSSPEECRELGFNLLAERITPKGSR